MKRARSIENIEALNLNIILERIAFKAVCEAFEDGTRKLRVECDIIPDHTMYLGCDLIRSSICIPPHQYNLFTETSNTVLLLRIDNTMFNVRFGVGYASCTLTFRKWIKNPDRIFLVCKVTDVDFSLTCYFGYNPCYVANNMTQDELKEIRSMVSCEGDFCDDCNQTYNCIVHSATKTKRCPTCGEK
jgi:hypothetical protein